MDRTGILALQAELVARFADDVAHEVRNPLNALVINIEVLRRRLSIGDTETALGRVDVIDSEVRRVHATIERFIALLRPPSVDDPTSDVAAALAEVIPLLTLRAAALRAAFEPPGEIDVDVRLPRDRLRFAILDAGMAAFDRAGPGGHLSCMAATAAGTCTILFRGGSAEPADAADGGPRLARAILDRVGGTISLRPGLAGGFEIELSIPAVA